MFVMLFFMLLTSQHRVQHEQLNFFLLQHILQYTKFQMCTFFEISLNYFKSYEFRSRIFDSKLLWHRLYPDTIMPTRNININKFLQPIKIVSLKLNELISDNDKYNNEDTPFFKIELMFYYLLVSIF